MEPRRLSVMVSPRVSGSAVTRVHRRPQQRSLANLPILQSKSGRPCTTPTGRAVHQPHVARQRPKAEGRPYDLRHSFASLLLHEGRSVIYVARQLGHDARLTLSTYGHVIDEFDDLPQLSAETAISEARAELATGKRPQDESRLA
jgi:site-specific recombinase XerD